MARRGHYIYIYLSIYIDTYLSIHPYGYLPYLPIYLSIHMDIDIDIGRVPIQIAR